MKFERELVGVQDENEATKKIKRDEILKRMKDAKDSIREDMFFFDIDLNHIIAPAKYIKAIVQQRITSCLFNILRAKVE